MGGLGLKIKLVLYFIKMRFMILIKAALNILKEQKYFGLRNAKLEKVIDSTNARLNT